MKDNLYVKELRAYEIIDSRGKPTIKTVCTLSDGSLGSASVPSGASTGKFEAKELRDNDNLRYNGKGVLKACENVNSEIFNALNTLKNPTQKSVDETMIKLDGSEDKSVLGANATLSVSLAFARAKAKSDGLALYRYIGGIFAKKLPTPMMNILNGGVHAKNNIDIQEFMIIPISSNMSFNEKLRTSCEIYYALGKLLEEKGLSTTVGDEGGFAPNLNSDEEAIVLICDAIKKAGFGFDTVKIGLDAAASEWVSGDEYVFPKRNRRCDRDELVNYWVSMCEKYPIISIEDGLGEDDFDGFSRLTDKLFGRARVVGDDLFVTNEKRLRKGIENRSGNSLIIKMNQIGTLTETLNTISLAKENGFETIISHRSGETEDNFISDLAVGVNSEKIKTGAPCRSERTSKYNRLLEIERELNL